MSTQVSFSKLEKKLLPQFRERISTSEDMVDVQKYFSYTIEEMFFKAFENQTISINEDDIQLLTEEPFYKIKKMEPALQSLWEHSDLKDIVKRFAVTTHKRFVHLQKNPSKTNKKIRR